MNAVTLLAIGMIILSCFLFISLYYNYKFARIIINLEDGIEGALDRLDERYQSISKILEIPLFYDSPQIRQVVRDIDESRNAILAVANSIATLEDENAEEKND